MKLLPEKHFYDATDAGLIDSNGKLSVCKPCIQNLYNGFYEEYGSIEKSLHKLCMSLNIKFSNEAASATQTQITTFIESGKTVRNVFGIYKSKLIAVNPSMDKSADMDLTYSDVGTIYVDKENIIEEAPIPKDVIDFWGADVPKEDIKYLENEYINFKKTHVAETYAEIVLLKQVCYTMLDIKRLRAAGEDTGTLVKELQALMKTLAVSPNATITANTGNKNSEAFGLWIKDIEENEPAQWLLSDPRGDIYRDVSNVDQYFQKYIVRPLKNFIQGSKDFNVAEEGEDDLFIIDDEDMPDYNLIDDGEV
jgi:hypothetical protein